MHRPTQRALALAVQLPSQSPSEVSTSMSELQQLAHGLGIQVVHQVVQRRPTATSPSLLGEGKLDELARLVAELKVEQVLVDGALGPGQQRQLEQALEVGVMDRTAVILRIFEQRAGTRQARLEVELARLRYELPRVRDDQTLGDREGGGGRAGRGNSNVELAKQRLRERIAAVRSELDAIEASTERRRAQEHDVFRVAFVGYTNAGKSSLMRALTGSEVLVEDKLFATLSPTVRPLLPRTTPPILVSDTVGFIRNLPSELVASFRSTLDEAKDAGLLLLVVDAADTEWRDQLRVTHETLDLIGVARAHRRVVLNKVDRLDPGERAKLATELPEGLQISAHRKEDAAVLRAVLVDAVDGELVTRTLEVPWAKAGVIAELRGQLRVVSEESGARLSLTVRAHPAVLARLERRLAE